MITADTLARRGFPFFPDAPRTDALDPREACSNLLLLATNALKRAMSSDDVDEVRRTADTFADAASVLAQTVASIRTAEDQLQSYALLLESEASHA